jgi:hypothetical protein
MAQLRAEGKMGPQFGRLGGRPRKDRAPVEKPQTAAQAVAAAARANRDKIAKVYTDAIQAGVSETTRLRAVGSWLGVEGEEAEREIREAEAEVERKALESMSRDELVGELASMFSKTPELAALLRNASQPALSEAS